MTQPKIRKHYPGVYRITLSPEKFGQIQRNTNNQWMAEIRRVDTGDLVRYAGIWPSLKEATEELLSTNKLDL